LPSTLDKLDKYDCLILDDFGYVQKDQAETGVLFELICERYESKSLLITCNQVFAEWDKIFVDKIMAVAAADRLIHHATILELNVESYRKKTARTRFNH
jgi:DNA replication protein DnaC